MKRNIKILLIICMIAIMQSCSSPTKVKDYYIASGPIQGTHYNVTYEWYEDISGEIDSVLHNFNKSLSNFDEESVISKINRNETDKVDSLFMQLFYVALEVYNETDGAFDITIAPIANLWSFGWKNTNTDKITDEKVDSVLQYVGMDMVQMQGNYIIKEKPQIEFIGSAIAKGQSVDYLAAFLDNKGVENYLIEVGGEISCVGKNVSGNKWRIGIDKPIVGSGYQDRENQIIIQLSDKSIATSGNYRQYIEQDGKKYGHSLNPVTGYPAENNLLSATVITDKCIFADAYATAFMVIGLEKSMEITEDNELLESYFIFIDDDGTIKDTKSSGFNQYHK